MVAYLVEWGWFKLGSYGLMMALGFLCAYFLLRKELVRKEIDPALASRVTFNGAIWGVIGARLLSVLEDPGRVAAEPVRTLLLEGGLTWYGGFVGAAVAIVYTVVKARASMLGVFDAASPATFVGYALGRLGCLLSGDGCYGEATSLPWGMAFPNAPHEPGFHCMRSGAIATWPPMDPSTGRRYPADVLVHPTPIYEALVALAVFGVLWLIRKRIRRTGTMFGLLFVFIAIPRFFVEFIRLNPRYFGLSLSQWIAIVFLVVGLALIGRSLAGGGRTSPAAEAQDAGDKRGGGRGKRKRR